jgi:enoyl-CoA hydratase/carnithine racemase
MRTYETLEYEKTHDGRVATIWLNRPDVLNCVNSTLARERVDALQWAADDEDVRAIVIRGRGRAFCAGRDLKELNAEALGNQAESWKIVRSSGLLALNNDWMIPKPTIALVHGFAVAGGFEMMMWTDFAIVADDAKIGDYHLRRGLLGGAGPYWSVPRIVGMRRAKELFFTGKLLTGKQAAEWGLVNLSVPEDQLDAALNEFLQDLIDKSPLALSWCKLALSRSFEADRETIAVLEHFMVMSNHQTRDAKEGATAFIEKRQPRYEGQ